MTIARKKYECHDCAERVGGIIAGAMNPQSTSLGLNPWRVAIERGEEYVTVYEYGETRKLHRECWLARARTAPLERLRRRS